MRFAVVSVLVPLDSGHLMVRRILCRAAIGLAVFTPASMLLTATPAHAAGLCFAGDALIGSVTSPGGDYIGDLCLGDAGLYLVFG